MLISFLILGSILGLVASFVAAKDTQTYAAPSIEAKPLKFIPQSMTAPKH